MNGVRDRDIPGTGPAHSEVTAPTPFLVRMSTPTDAVRPSAAGWAAAGFVLLYLVCVRTPVGQQLDDAAMRWTAAAVIRDGWAEALLEALSAGSLLLAGAALAVVTAATRGPRTAAVGAVSGAVVLLGAEVLKLVLTRPDFSVQALANSFPSGHVAAVTGLSVALLLATPSGTWRRAALVAATAAVTLTGAATVVLEWHRPSDVLGSVLLGGVVCVTATRWDSHGRPTVAAPVSLATTGVGSQRRGV